MTLCNCYWEWVLVQYEDQREREGEGEGEAGRDAKVLAGLPWCSPVNPSLSVALRGHLYSSRSLIMGALPTAAARCNGVCCIRLSLTLEVAPLWKSSLAMSMLDLDAQKCRAVWPASSYTKQSPGKKKKREKKGNVSTESNMISGLKKRAGGLLLTLRIDIRASTEQFFH